MDKYFDEHHCDNIDIDELFKKQHEVEQNKITNYEKILKRIHKRIKTTANHKKDKFCFYIFQDFNPGVTITNKENCIAYISKKLTENGFFVRYTHPNLFFISWNHYIPFYQRDIIRTSTGVKVDGLGNIISKKENKMLTFGKDTNQESKSKKIETYKSIDSIYDNSILEKINLTLHDE